MTHVALKRDSTGARHPRSLRQAGREELDVLLASLSEKIADVRGSLATAFDDGADTLEEGFDAVVRKSSRGVRALDRRWHRLDRKQKLGIAGGLLAALAAAATTVIVKRSRAA